MMVTTKKNTSKVLYTSANAEIQPIPAKPTDYPPQHSLLHIHSTVLTSTLVFALAESGPHSGLPPNRVYRVLEEEHLRKYDHSLHT